MSVFKNRFEPACESHVGMNPGAGETKKARVWPSRIGAAYISRLTSRRRGEAVTLDIFHTGFHIFVGHG